MAQALPHVYPAVPAARCQPPLPKRIAIIAGNARSLVANRGAMIRHWLALGHEVHALVPTSDYQAAADGLGIPIHPIGLARTSTNPLHDASITLAMARILRSIRPDMTFSYTIKPVVYGSLAATLARVPERYSMITGAGFLFEGSSVRRRALRGVGVALYRAALPRNRKVFLQNPDDIALFQRHRLLRADQVVRTWGSGVDLEQFPRSPLPSGPTRFLMIARILGDKGVREYIEAARSLKPAWPDARFELLGPHDPNLPHAIPKTELDALLSDGATQWLGATADVRPFIEAAHVVVLPSYREGTPRSVLEAMAMGRAVITTDAPGCRETIVHEESGLLVPVRDAAALAHAMERLLRKPEQISQFAARGHERARSHFDVRSVNDTISRAMRLTRQEGTE